jgi:hypothetical protein
MAYTADYAASVQGVAIRVTRLDPNGVLIPTESYTSKSFIRVSFTPEYEEGDEITEKNADGTVCVTYKAPDTLKRATMEVAVCDPDPVLSSMLSGGIILAGMVEPQPQTPDADTDVYPLGWASAGVGEDPSGNGVAVEVWSRAIVDGKAALQMPFFHWVFPYVKTRLSGDRVIENGLLANTYEGFGVGNRAFGEGPDASSGVEEGSTAWRWPEVTDRPYMYARAGSAPNVARGLWNWTTGTPVAIDAMDLDEGAGGFDPEDPDRVYIDTDQPPTTTP